MNARRKILLALILIIFFSGFSRPVSASPPEFAVTTAYRIDDPNLLDGDIVSLSSKDASLHLSMTKYDETMHGVYVKSPKIVYRTPDNRFPVARNGEVDVNVTAINGGIKIGDYVSSSEIPGKAMRATDFTGYMLGVALEAFDGNNGTNLSYHGKTYKAGKIRVAVGIGPASPSVIKASGGLFGTLRFLSTSLAYNIANSKEAERVMKIIMAVIIALASIIFAVNFFGKNVTEGIRSIGRNPLAKSAIQMMIVVNVILIGAIALGGIILAMVIISI